MKEIARSIAAIGYKVWAIIGGRSAVIPKADRSIGGWL
jgi:hypothetical protein